ncbi:MAG: hypothetical protein AB1461_07710 [Thermodesulfobacteriota bacterium]
MDKKTVIGLATGIIALFTFMDWVPETTCRDGWKSPSIGRPGACSHHGGVDYHGELRFLALIGSIICGFGAYYLFSSKEKKLKQREIERETESKEEFEKRKALQLERENFKKTGGKSIVLLSSLLSGLYGAATSTKGPIVGLLGGAFLGLFILGGFLLIAFYLFAWFKFRNKI